MQPLLLPAALSMAAITSVFNNTPQMNSIMDHV